MRWLLHWTVFLGLLLPLVWAGWSRLHYGSFPLYLAVLGAVCLAVLLVQRQLERLAPVNNEEEGN
jgi:hypothetical protein